MRVREMNPNFYNFEGIVAGTVTELVNEVTQDEINYE